MEELKKETLKNINKTVGGFLKKNGFIDTEKYAYANEYCGVVVTEKGYEVADNEGNVMYFEEHTIYSLIGYLTYSNYMDKNYIL